MQKAKNWNLFQRQASRGLDLILKVKTSLTRSYEEIYVCGLQNVTVWHFLGVKGEQWNTIQQVKGETRNYYNISVEQRWRCRQGWTNSKSISDHFAILVSFTFGLKKTGKHCTMQKLKNGVKSGQLWQIISPPMFNENSPNLEGWCKNIQKIKKIIDFPNIFKKGFLKL